MHATTDADLSHAQRMQMFCDDKHSHCMYCVLCSLRWGLAGATVALGTEGTEFALRKRERKTEEARGRGEASSCAFSLAQFSVVKT